VLWGFAAAVVFGVTMITGCGSRPGQPVESLGGGSDLAAFVLRSLKGTRDGDVLVVRAEYGAGAQSLRVDLRFRVTPPTRLESGTWAGLGGEGTVRERSVTFLGGQSGPPSIGGKFELIDPGSRTVYRITIPLQELRRAL
jgi:hypothetical protein